MTTESVAEVMNRLPEVTWDRCTRGECNLTVYGWIAREDGRHDFVVVFFGPEGVGFVTSSARYSKEFSARLFGNADNHRDCERVEDVFGELVGRKVVLVANPGAKE